MSVSWRTWEDQEMTVTSFSSSASAVGVNNWYWYTGHRSACLEIGREWRRNEVTLSAIQTLRVGKITWRKLPAPLQNAWIWQGERAFRKHFTDTLSGSVKSRMSMLGTEWEPSLRFLFSLTYFTKDPPGKSRDSDDKVKKKRKSKLTTSSKDK